MVYFFTQDGQKYNLYNLPSGLVIRGSVNLSNMGLTRLPDMSKCTVNGHFICSLNPLDSLAGCPQSVSSFVCEYTDIRDLRGAPKMADLVSVRHNRLTSLVGAPRNIYYDESFWRQHPDEPRYLEWETVFDCSNNELTSLTGLTMGWTELRCNNNQIKSLSAWRMHPSSDKKWVHCYLWCANNNLVRLNLDSEMSGHGRIFNFSGNPCTTKYVESILKQRGITDAPTTLDIVAATKYLTYSLEDDYNDFMSIDELRIANRELFDNKKTFARGATVVKARTKRTTPQQQITVAKDDKVH